MTEVCPGDTEDTVTLRLGSLAKIPASRLGKGVAAVVAGPDGTATGVTTVFPPAFTVVLGGLPSLLAHRLLASDSPNAHIFAQSAASLPATPTAAAVIAAAPNPADVGSLFPTRLGNGEITPGPTITDPIATMAPSTAGSASSHTLRHATHGRNSSRFPEVDESSSAVAELTSEQAIVNIVQGEPFEEINDAIPLAHP